MTQTNRRRTTLRRSPIHGRGVYALHDLAPGELLLRFTGEVTTWEDATARYEIGSSGDQGSTYLLDLGDGTVLDCATGSSSTRFVNHSCEPNCEIVDVDGRIYLAALTRVPAGAELVVDYALVVDDPDDPDTRDLYACRCFASSCRATMLAAG